MPKATLNSPSKKSHTSTHSSMRAKVIVKQALLAANQEQVTPPRAPEVDESRGAGTNAPYRPFKSEAERRHAEANCPTHGTVYDKGCAKCEFRKCVVPKMQVRGQKQREESNAQVAANLAKSKEDKDMVNDSQEQYDAWPLEIAHMHPDPPHSRIHLLDPGHPVSIAAANYIPTGISCLPPDLAEEYEELLRQPCYNYSPA